MPAKRATIKQPRRRSETGFPSLPAALECLGDGFLAIDLEWRIEFLNPAASRLLGSQLANGDWLGCDLREALPELTGSEAGRRLQKALGPGGPAAVDLFHNASRRWLEARFFPGTGGLTVLLRDITRSREWSQAQIHGEELLRAVMEGTRDAVFLKNLKGEYLVINPAGAHLLDREPSQVLGRTDKDLWPREIAEQIALGDREILRSGKIREWQYIQKRPMAPRHILSTKGPYHDRHGNLVGIVGIARDITAEVTAREEFRRNEARFRTLVLASSQAVYTTNSIGEISEDSPSWRALTGQTYRQMQGIGWLDVVHPEERQRVLRETRRALGLEQSFNLEYRLWAADHSYRHISLKAVPVLSESGALLEWVMAHSDITEQKNHDREQAERTRLLTVRTYIAELLTRSDDLHLILQRCTEALVQNLQVGLAQIWSSEENGDLHLESSAGEFDRAPQSAQERPEVRWVAGKRQPYVTNAGSNDAVLGEVPWLKENDLNFFAGYPMILEDRVVGVLATYANRTLSVNILQELAGIVEGLGQWILRKQQEQERQQLLQIAERERAKAEATQSHFHLLTELVPQLVWTSGPDGEAEWFNQRWCDATGLSVADLLGLGWLQAVHPEDSASTRAAWAAATLEVTPHEVEFRIRNPAGEYRWYISRALPLKDAAGKVLKWFGTCTDIHDQKTAVEAIRESEARYRGVVESELLPILYWHIDGHLLDGNKLAVKVLGYSREELQSGKIRWQDITPSEYHALDRRKIKEIKGTGIALPFEKEYFRKDGERIGVMLGCCLLPGYQDRGVAFVLNLEHLRKADRETTRLYRRKKTPATATITGI